MKHIRLVVVTLVVAVTAAGCRGGGDDHLGSLTADGTVLVARGEGAFRAVSEAKLHDGDRVRVSTGSALVRMRALSINLRKDSELRMATVPELTRGDALVVPSKGTPSISAGPSTVAVTGATRLARNLAFTVASYRGTANVQRRWPRARGARPPAGDDRRHHPVATEAEPAELQRRRPWDRRYLGAAIDLGDELESRSRGFSAQLKPGEGRTPGFFRLLLPALEKEPTLDGLVTGDRPPGETLVGAAIVSLARQNTFTERWASAFDFRDEGAAWGLVALDQGVTSTPDITDAVDAAIGRAPLQVALPARDTPSTSSGSLAPGIPGGSPAPSPSPTPPPPGSPPGTTPPPATPPPDPAPADGPLPSIPPGTLLDPLAPTVNEVIDLLNGILESGEFSCSI